MEALFAVPKVSEESESAPQTVVRTKTVETEEITDDKQKTVKVTTTVHYPAESTSDDLLIYSRPKRVCRPPDRYKPVEICVDDYTDDEDWDEDLDSDEDIEDGDYDDEETEDDDDDAGSLEDFIASDDEDEDGDYEDDDEEEEMSDEDTDEEEEEEDI